MSTQSQRTAVQELDSRFVDPEQARRRPEATHRWLQRSISAGTPDFTSVQLELEGHIKLGSWHRFTATQTIRPRYGYTWKGRTTVGGVPVSGVETMTPSTARKMWQAAGFLPVVRADGPDVLNSAAGRLAAESVFVPTTFGIAVWEPAASPDSAFATWRIGARVDRVRIDVAPNGRLRSVSLRRWGTPPGGRYGRHLFGLNFEEEITFDGVTIPRTMTAHWWIGTEREDGGAVLRAQVVGAHFL